MFDRHFTKDEVLHQEFLQQMWPNPQSPLGLVLFAEDILIEKLHFWCNQNPEYFSKILLKLEILRKLPFLRIKFLNLKKGYKLELSRPLLKVG